jgi:fumarate hydratase subunit beta
VDKIRISTPLTEAFCRNLIAGTEVLITGTIYTARDAAHMRLLSLIRSGEPLPFDLEGQIIYYAGPSPARPGEVIGACGPTTSYRMDDLTEPLLRLGLKGMIGKGQRSPEVIEQMKTYGAVYFTTIGGAGALIASRVIKSTPVAFEDLGAEAILKLEVVDFPSIVTIDTHGKNLYEKVR